MPIINPTNMSADEVYILDHLLSFHYETTQFNPDVPYQFLLPDLTSGETISKSVKLTHEIIKRPCRPGGKHDGQFRYEVISNGPALGSGTSSTVLKTIATFAPSFNDQPAYYKEKERVAKCFWQEAENSDHEDSKPFTFEDVQREYDQTPPHMHMKPPIKLEKDLCLVMKKAEGELLRKIIASKKLNFDKRLSLCKALVEALLEQVHHFNLVHRDFKPDNILAYYDENKNKWVVTIIDFGLSKKSETDDSKESIGTPLYAAPEVRLFLGTTLKSDIYSLACIFSEILGCNRDKLIKTWTDLNNELANHHIFLDGLLKNMPGSNAHIKPALESLLKDMSQCSDDVDEMKEKQALRPDTNVILSKLQSFSFFNQIENENRASTVSKSLSASSDMLLAPVTNLTI